MNKAISETEQSKLERLNCDGKMTYDKCCGCIQCTYVLFQSEGAVYLKCRVTETYTRITQRKADAMTVDLTENSISHLIALRSRTGLEFSEIVEHALDVVNRIIGEKAGVEDALKVQHMEKLMDEGTAL